MPGFLAAYEGTERIPLPGGYWVDVKRCLSSAEYAPVELALGSLAARPFDLGEHRARIVERGPGGFQSGTGIGKAAIGVI